MGGGSAACTLHQHTRLQHAGALALATGRLVVLVAVRSDDAGHAAQHETPASTAWIADCCCIAPAWRVPHRFVATAWTNMTVPGRHAWCLSSATVRPFGCGSAASDGMRKNKTGWASAPRRVWRRPEHRPLRIQQRWARFSLWIFDDLAARLMHGGQSVADPPSYTFSASSFGVCCARGALGPLGRSSSVGSTRSHLA